MCLRLKTYRLSFCFYKSSLSFFQRRAYPCARFPLCPYWKSMYVFLLGFSAAAAQQVQWSGCIRETHQQQTGDQEGSIARQYLE